MIELETNPERDGVVAAMRSCRELVGNVRGKLPAGLIVAVATGRPELAAMCKGTPLTPEESDTTIDLIVALLETNSALQLHAEKLAAKVKGFAQTFKSLDTTATRIEQFANFNDEDDGDHR